MRDFAPLKWLGYFFWFLRKATAETRAPISTQNTSNDAVPRKEVPFGGRDCHCLLLSGRIAMQSIACGLLLAMFRGAHCVCETRALSSARPNITVLQLSTTIVSSRTRLFMGAAHVIAYYNDCTGPLLSARFRKRSHRAPAISLASESSGAVGCA